MHELLRRFDTFATLDAALLGTISRLSSRVRFPAGRWLLRPGRSLNHHHFLLSGKVRTLAPEGVVRASRVQARAPLFPGHAGIFTLTDVEMLRIGSSELEFLLEGQQLSAGAVDESGDGWQMRFLRSHMMSSLPMSCWQSLLRVLEPQVFEAGVDVLVEDESATANGGHCFILAAGRAVIHRREQGSARVLRHLGPGDFFGEDALLSGRPRNATVTALDRIRVMQLDVADFQRFLLRAMLAEESTDGGSRVRVANAEEATRAAHPNAATYSNICCTSLPVDSAHGLRGRLEALDPCGSYLIRGDDPDLVALALFLLRQRGINAHRASLAP